jgi:hypothetical protein
MRIKIYLQFAPRYLVGETLRNTYLLFFNKKKGTYCWFNIKHVVEHGVAEQWQEVEFEKWEHAKELFCFHKEVARKRGDCGRMPFFGDKATLQIGKTDKWTKW